jgi:hypothetical protein
MRPRSIGRTVGIGLRVAGRVVGQRVAGSVQSAVSAPSPDVPAQAAAVDLPAKERAAGQAAGKATVRATGGIGRGVAGFLRPFQRVGGILWLEVTGVFFLVFVLAFAPVLWRTRLSYAHGQDQRTFWAAAIIIAVFLYLSISSFWKARKR